MEKIKSYTDLEQSKKLAKILPIESADMTWCYNNSIKGVNYTNQSFANLRPVKEVIEVLDQTLSRWDKHWELIPCWSLSALLDLMPKIHGERPRLDTGRIQTEKYYVEYPYHESTKNDWYSTKLCDSAVDATFEMICCLKEHNKI